MSNYATPPQLVEHVPYGDLEQMQAFALRWRAEHRGQWFTAAKLSGFCLLMKRAVYEAIGGLDERFGLGFFDDDDLADESQERRVFTGRGPRPVRPPLRQPDVPGSGIDVEQLLSENGAGSRPSGELPGVNGHRSGPTTMVSQSPETGLERAEPGPSLLDDDRARRAGEPAELPVIGGRTVR